MDNIPYGDHLCPRGAKMTENSVFSCFLAKNRLFGPKGCLDRENCHHKEDLPLESLCFDSFHLNLRGSARYLSTGLKVSRGIVHKLTKSHGN